MTDRLYYRDAYRDRFDARVVERADDGRRIYLDRTAFYPTSGGQPHDLGTLGGIPVLDVVDEEERIAHLLEAPLASDTTVEGVIDWARRWDHMQQHTGQHLLSALCADHFGWATLSVHFGAESSTLDLEVESIAPDSLREIEHLANAAVAAQRPVVVSFEDAAQVVGLRKPSDRGGMLRVVSIEGMDRSACGGTHVRSTAEVGTIVLRRVERVRPSTRVEFLCGRRAIARVRADYDTLSRLAQGASCAIDELATLIPAQAEQLRSLENERRRLQEELHTWRAREAYSATAPDADGVRRLIERRPSGKVDEARGFALAYCALPQALCLVAVASPPAVLVAASDDSGVDAGKALKGALGVVGGRGGGSPRLAQGTVPSVEALEQVLAALAPGPAT